jgi:hypothetical protein
VASDTDADPVVVERTGLALLHKGELVVPEAGSEALLSIVNGDGTLVLEFPVEVEVRVVDPCDPDRHADVTLTRLLHALGGLA